MGWRPLPGHEPERLTRVGDSVERVLRHLGAPRAEVLTTVFSRWAALVGDQVAAHAEPVSVRDGRLAVRVDDPAWASQLRWLERDLLTQLAALVGAGVITAIDVRVGAVDRPRRGRASGPRAR